MHSPTIKPGPIKLQQCDVLCHILCHSLTFPEVRTPMSVQTVVEKAAAAANTVRTTNPRGMACCCWTVDRYGKPTAGST